MNISISIENLYFCSYIFYVVCLTLSWPAPIFRWRFVNLWFSTNPSHDQKVWHYSYSGDSELFKNKFLSPFSSDKLNYFLVYNFILLRLAFMMYLISLHFKYLSCMQFLRKSWLFPLFAKLTFSVLRTWRKWITQQVRVN